MKTTPRLFTFQKLPGAWKASHGWLDLFRFMRSISLGAGGGVWVLQPRQRSAGRGNNTSRRSRRCWQNPKRLTCIVSYLPPLSLPLSLSPYFLLPFFLPSFYSFFFLITFSSSSYSIPVTFGGWKLRKIRSFFLELIVKSKRKTETKSSQLPNVSTGPVLHCAFRIHYFT